MLELPLSTNLVTNGIGMDVDLATFWIIGLGAINLDCLLDLIPTVVLRGVTSICGALLPQVPHLAMVILVWWHLKYIHRPGPPEIKHLWRGRIYDFCYRID